MKIFSISTHHDSNYCVFEDGNVIVHNELERFSRKKHDWSPQRLFSLVVKDQHLESSDIITMPINFDEVGQMGGFDFLKLKQEKYFVGHHMCHASNAYFSSPFDDAIIFTFDGGGHENIDGINETVSSCVFHAKQNKIHRVSANSDFLYNVGQHWIRMLRDVFSMKDIWSDEGDQSGSLMALAALGTPYKYLNHFEDILYANYLPQRHLTCVNDYNIVQAENKLYEEKIKSLKQIVNLSDQDRYDMASSLQYSLERYMMTYVMSQLTYGKTKNVCFSGGVSLNCIALGKIAKVLMNKGYNVFCDFAPNDSGLSVGAAKYYYYHVLGNPWTKTVQTPYLGKDYSGLDVTAALGMHYENINVKHNVSLEDIVTLLTDSNIISVFNGGSESGKRALGNRSILADPRSPDMKDMINDKVKHRQKYRPFAPSILREHVIDWFEFDIDSPYMSFAIPVRKDKQDLIPAVVHYDSTARLQTVTPELNGYYYDLIQLFYNKTGVPILLNTSFNDREPIVETPDDAIKCFLGTNIDYLYFVKEKILITKKG